jgi:NAD+ diphosphatase
MQDTRFVRSHTTSDTIAENARWFVFIGDRLLLEDAEQPSVPDSAMLETLGIRPEIPLLLGEMDGVTYYGANNIDNVVQSGIRLFDLRQTWSLLGAELYAIAAYAFQIAHWERTTRFCPVCGRPTEQVPTERAKLCEVCNFFQYPRVSPCIIVLIYREGQVLLTRQARWTPGMYSLVAGFVEAGESLESCLRREIAEEVGVRVDTIEYLGSQPWPFPHQLMTGFRAHYRDGDVAVDTMELEEAKWFDLDALPGLSSPMSISRQIIDWHLASQQQPGLPFPEM